MTKVYRGYSQIREIIETGEIPKGRSFYSDDILEVLRIVHNEDSCRVCGSTENLTVDHIHPRRFRAGLRRQLYNLQVLCEYHNNLKADLLPGKNGWWPDELMEYLNE
jgi:5-methylcytosine-specific restriction endonuclease McrA